MGANIVDISNTRSIITGIDNFHANKFLRADDIRGGASITLAALSAVGETHIHNLFQIDRGYESLENKLRSIGADIERLTK